MRIGGRVLICGWLVLTFPAMARAATYRVEAIDQPAPTEGVSDEISKLLAPKGVAVIRGESRTVCEIWMCRELPIENEKPEGTARYPFRQGQLLGLVHFPRKSTDFRKQAIESGAYTLRYARIPVDGDHQGVSPTPDFLLIVALDHDKTAGDVSLEDLKKLSAEAVGTDHPGNLALKPVEGTDKPPSIRHNEEKDWWIVRLQTTVKVGDAVKDLPLDLVVVGSTEE